MNMRNGMFGSLRNRNLNCYYETGILSIKVLHNFFNTSFCGIVSFKQEFGIIMMLF